MTKRQAFKIVRRGSWDGLRKDGAPRWREPTLDDAVRVFCRAVGHLAVTVLRVVRRTA